MRQLARFSIIPHGDGAVLRLEDVSGEVAEFRAEPEQLDDVIDALDGLLSEEDESLLPGLSNGAALLRH